MSFVSGEQKLFGNGFGQISDRRLIYNRKKSWFSGKYREDIPLKQVASVRHKTSRSLFWGIFWLLIGLSIAFSPPKVGSPIPTTIMGILLLAWAIILLWGSPQVMVVTTGGTTTPSVGWPWERKDAESFVNALRNQLFKE